ncbi:hypothetical protein [Thiomicrospira sp.]|uniref:hypothetical protein n=1 Tax=Thiomicrospira sp. TaxID=935 RepID=UPI002F9439D6
MANQTMTVTGNIGSTPTFKTGEYNLCEIFLITEEYKNGDNGLEAREGSQATYQVTVWAPRDQPQALEQLKVLKKGMRIEVSGAFKAAPYQKDNGETDIGRAISCSPSDIKLKLNRIESIQMKPSQRDQQGMPPAQPAQQYASMEAQLPDPGQMPGQFDHQNY